MDIFTGRRIPRWLSLLTLLVVLGLGLAPMAGAAIARYPAEPNRIEVIFADDSMVRLRGGELVDLKTRALDGLSDLLQPLGAFTWERICEVPEAKLDQLRRNGEANGGRPLYDLNNIYRLRVPVGTDVWALSRKLESLPGIVSAAPVPQPVAPPVPNYQPNQGYEDPAGSFPAGIDAEYAWTRAGGTGLGVTVCDLEYSWNYNHADVTRALGSQINQQGVQDPFGDTSHGTAVIGETASDNNGWGTTGICFDSGLKTCGTYFGLPDPAWNVPGAIAIAATNLKAGDVILLEQQWDYENPNTPDPDYVPIEWWTNRYPGSQTSNAVYRAIVDAVSSGIQVVEAGGNGGYDTGTLAWFGDSGAIIVGAGGAYPGGTYGGTNLERLSFSSYGPRFNLQGWGEDVYTTGYGDLYNQGGSDYWYTNTFSGTSSASAIVAAAAASYVGYYTTNISSLPPPPAGVRTLLMNTGTPQYFGLAGNIGPRPDLRAAIEAQPPGACCFTDGHCEYLPRSGCPTGIWQMLIPCQPNPCPPAGACCFPDDHCENLVQSSCPGEWWGQYVCSPGFCPSPTAAPVALTVPRLALLGGRPNPFHSRTTISFDLPRSMAVELGIFDAGGRLVRRLASGAMARGLHKAEWDGRNQDGARVSPGIYFCRLAADNEVRVRVLTLIGGAAE